MPHRRPASPGALSRRLRRLFPHLLTATLTLALAACCKLADHTDSEAPSAAPATAAPDDPAEIARRLEELHQSGQLPAGSAQAIAVRGQLIRLKGDQVIARDAVPEALHKHGEALRGVWVAPDGTAFAAGYMYTGVDGPDTGAVYRRTPGGAWELVYHKPKNELGTLWGRSASDVYAAGVRTVAHFDGKAWSEVPIPGLEGNVQGLWGNATDLWVAGGELFAKKEAGRIHHRGPDGQWKREAVAPAYLYAMSGAGDAVWAVGDRGTVLRRGKDGVWKAENSGVTSQHTCVWAIAEDDVYIAGSVLLHSTGNGVWTAVKLPGQAQVTDVWGRARDDVYAGTMGGLLHLTGGQWARTGYLQEVSAIGGTADEVLVSHDQMN